ncbi:GGDEF domain-containing protein [Tepiditoga spiralis]|uniref:GGDEF domain-containing protein n=1 Tax=Tepiditoga spiralis TaxID=2108365 RepID=A0A7G1G5U6_9BACT|nr:diguanylate cyclase [Tepiditoga spiralis]BBE30153.1 GGDEF domain-containing protein [Tepiditoga spiralis]
MYKKQIKKKSLKLFFEIFILSSIILSFIVFFTYKVRMNNYINILLENEKNKISLQNEFIKVFMEDLTKDLNFLSYSEIPYRASYLNKNISSLKNSQLEIINFSKYKKVYDQIRFIDLNGNEQMRVNYNNGNIKVLKKDELQNKSHRYYFKDMKYIKKDEIYVSYFDLNVEKKEIEVPYKPTIRFLQPYYYDGEKIGYIVLNYIGNNFIEEFKNIRKRMYLLDEDGYFLITPNKEDEWGFMFGEKDKTFKNYYPEVSKEVFSKKSGTIKFKNIIYVFNTIDLKLFSNIKNKTTWKVVSYIKNDDYKKISNNLFFNTLILYIFMIIIILIVSYIITRYNYQKLYNEELIKEYATYDELTHLYNRRIVMNFLNELIKLSNREHNKFCVCFADVNNLKKVNDTLGHDYGDDLIKTVARILKETVREVDIVGRIGGDEFLILFPKCDKENAEKIWNRINKKFEEINSTNEKKFKVVVAHGIEEYQNKMNINELIKIADQKMYEDKKRLKSNQNKL